MAPGAIIKPMSTHPVSGDRAVLHTNYGDITVGFYPDKAPKHVESFTKLAREGFYDGTEFHRVIPGFMVQGGDPYSKTGEGPVGTGGPGYQVPAEFNDIKHTRGILSAARSANPNSAGSQFFLMVATATHLDGQYSVFGTVLEGMEVVDQIVSLPRDSRDRPLAANRARIEKITFVEAPGS